NTLTHLYIPPLIESHYWLDPTLPLIITEGEKKALKACQEGLLCVALGGVQNWRQRTLVLPQSALATDQPYKDKLLLQDLDPDLLQQFEEQVCPELLQIPFDNREVVICFDSDTLSNPAVQLSAFELSIWLIEQGAIPCQ